MRYYLYSAGLIILAIIITTAIPFVVEFSENELISSAIPLNNSSVAGIQKYNIPPVVGSLPVPIVSARAVFIEDLATNTILYQKDADTPLPIASTTKIMTALVGVEYFKQNSILTIGSSANIPGSRVGLVSGENLSFRSLLYGMLLNSGNDAAFALAENYPGGVLSFISAMNKKVLELNLHSTHFDNPAGFDSPNHYSSAADLAKITKEALKNSQLARIFATKETNIVSLDKRYSHQLFNLNKLLTQINGVLGIKTGTTDQAKENLVTLIERDGHRVLIIILGSNDRFGETTRLIDWTYTNVTWPETETPR
ncbi:MAG: D-alanyl-D-alanine carboxypeptidase [Candidatus Daviesbacteria bacterium]|nr:D-alanyl-D-alanine carboxypeptidase [Candidatus Daviesbacteria bacterium]